MLQKWDDHIVHMLGLMGKVLRAGTASLERVFRKKTVNCFLHGYLSASASARQRLKLLIESWERNGRVNAREVLHEKVLCQMYAGALRIDTEESAACCRSSQRDVSR